MAARIKQPGGMVVETDLPEVAQAGLPLLASSTFCDDVRLEATGKFSMIGCYPGNVIVTNPLQPVSQIWVFTRLMWRRDFDATGLRMRIDLPAQEPSYTPVQLNPSPAEVLSCNALCIWQVRFHPLRVGDLLRISVERGPTQLPCGELLAVANTQPTRH